MRIIPYCGSINPGKVFLQEAVNKNHMIFLYLGEKCDVKLEVTLESNLEKIYDILVLHLKGGKDMFITVSGECQRSCFTSSISALCRISVPVMQLSDEQWKMAVRNSKITQLFYI